MRDETLGCAPGWSMADRHAPHALCSRCSRSAVGLQVRAVTSALPVVPQTWSPRTAIRNDGK